METNALKIVNVSKKYSIGSKRDDTLRGLIQNLLKKGTKNLEFLALNNISLEIKKGEIVGIIGQNGAGKSTLLKILSQITRPQSGKIEINGRIASLLEVGTGFHPELTGRENIYLNGTILGMTRKEVKAKFQDIIEFSGVDKFIDTPVKHYSSGMYVRLAFAVAAHLEPEILIIDEVLAVGDMEFQEKCLGKMKEVSKKGRTVIFVSHSMEAISNLCSRTIILDSGKIIFDGSVDSGIEVYRKLNRSITLSKFERKSSLPNTFNSVYFEDEKESFEHSEVIKIILDSESGLKSVFVGIAVLNDRKNKIFTSVHYIDSEKNKITCSIPSKLLLSGNYSLDVATFKEKEVIEYYNDICPFKIMDYTNNFRIFGQKIGDVFVNCRWEEVK